MQEITPKHCSACPLSPNHCAVGSRSESVIEWSGIGFAQYKLSFVAGLEIHWVS
jgi:hypothetical protein